MPHSSEKNKTKLQTKTLRKGLDPLIQAEIIKVHGRRAEGGGKCAGKGKQGGAKGNHQTTMPVVQQGSQVRVLEKTRSHLSLGGREKKKRKNSWGYDCTTEI